jgi:hypothetical protein
MATVVNVGGQNVSVSGTPGQLSLTESTFIGPEGLTISSVGEFVAVVTAIASEAKAAFPGIMITISKDEESKP